MYSLFVIVLINISCLTTTCSVNIDNMLYKKEYKCVQTFWGAVAQNMSKSTRAGFK